jgi:hypothetical protein
MLTACPPIVTVAVRALVVVLAAAVKVTLPLPLPVLGDTVNQLLSLVANQPQAVADDTVIVPVPPVEATEVDEGDNV